MSRDDAYALDMLIAAKRAASFVEHMTWEEFNASLLTQSAVLHQLIVLGEAARRVSHEYKADHPEVEWTASAGLRNRIIHEYDRVLLDRVWAVLTDELPSLINALHVFVREHP